MPGRQLTDVEKTYAFVIQQLKGLSKWLTIPLQKAESVPKQFDQAIVKNEFSIM